MANKCICNQCGAEFEMTLRHRVDGDIDITYLRCPFCNEEYMVSVTDSVLREAIDEYKKTVGAAKDAADAETSDRLVRAARQMKENNSKRCFELMVEYHNTNHKKTK